MNEQVKQALEDAHAEILAWRRWAEENYGRGSGPEKPLVTSRVLRNIRDALTQDAELADSEQPT